MDGTGRRAGWGAWWNRRRPRLDDLALSAVTLIGALIVVLNAANNELLGPSAWAGAALTAAMAVALWWRRQRPLLLAVAGCVIVVLGASPVVLSVTLATPPVRRRDRVLVLATVGAVAARLVAPWRYGAPTTVGGWVTSQLLTLSLFVFLPVVFGAFIGARRTSWPHCESALSAPRRSSSCAPSRLVPPSGPASPGRCTTCSAIASPWWPCTPVARKCRRSRRRP